ncbi:arogenate dehydrogenase 2, chloroplastic-like [Phalaenopsis equestris]|uniref:arogenate dehydrogenase 2, chloroplastic-like n=1 Tax=Phalaenopsis equestris TaxID=78828 RepID=UPI0009E52E90|nr:arogenate dehydrogenase 2, chloroplastic-like [Phalaenopsis equestris]
MASTSSSFLHIFQTKTSLQTSKDTENFPSQHKQRHYSSPSLKKIQQTTAAKLGFHRQSLALQRSFMNRTKCAVNLESPLMNMDEKEAPLRIGIVGLGNFGQFIAQGLKRQGHQVLATSRSDYTDYCKLNGIHFFRSMDGMCEEKPDIMLICSSILSTEKIVRTIPFHKLKPDTIFVDVLSVKQFPKNLFLEVLPPEFGIVCTHPMFGPESGKDGWAGLPFVFDRVRVIRDSLQTLNCQRFLSIFEHEGCRMVEMSCEEHDRHAAGSQFITHTIGRILSQLNLESTPINTKGYETLLKLTENTVSDSFDLYYGLFMYNVNATEQIDNLDRAFDTVKQKLFRRLHDILRKQIVERVPIPMELNVERLRKKNSVSAPSFLPKAQDMYIKDISSFAVRGEVIANSKALPPGIL